MVNLSISVGIDMIELSYRLWETSLFKGVWHMLNSLEVNYSPR